MLHSAARSPWLDPLPPSLTKTSLAPEGGQIGVPRPRASAWVTRPLPGGPAASLAPPATPAAARTPGHRAGWDHAALGDLLAPPRIGNTGGCGGFSPKRIAPLGAGVAKTKTDKLCEPSTEPPTHPARPSLCVYIRKDCACAAGPPGGRGGASSDSPEVWAR